MERLLLIALIIGTAVLLALLFLMHRQIVDLARQLRRYVGQETNQRVTQELYFPAVNELVAAFNARLDSEHNALTEMRRNEEAFLQSMTNLSHDVRTPLTSLSGYAQLAQDSGSEEDRTRYLAIMQERIAHLQDLTEKLFLYLKLQDETYEMDLEPLDVRELLLQTLLTRITEFEAAGVEPDLDIPELPVIVTADRMALIRIFENLATNVLKHGVPPFRVSLGEKDGAVTIAWTNGVPAGVVIDPDRLLSRFYRADPSRRGDSTGLGLSIVATSMERMGGHTTGSFSSGTLTVELGFPRA